VGDGKQKVDLGVELFSKLKHGRNHLCLRHFTSPHPSLKKKGYTHGQKCWQSELLSSSVPQAGARCMLWKKHRPESATTECAQCLETSCCSTCAQMESRPSSGAVAPTTETKSPNVRGHWSSEYVFPVRPHLDVQLSK
jgi:hypothetical protein